MGINQPVLILFAAGVPLFILFGWYFSGFIKTQQNINKLVLIGLTFNLLVGAVFSLWQFLFLAFNLPFPVELWFGHFRFADSLSLIILLITEIFFISGWILLRKKLMAFSLGRSISSNLNQNYSALNASMFIFVAVGTFAVVSLFGAFSFLGLIFPIVSRRFWFRNHDLRGEFFPGSIVNGLFLMSIDAICYYFPIYGAEVPVGLIATAVGAVSLIFLLWKSDSHLEILAKTQK
jgi:iron complex transport system permease protein